MRLPMAVAALLALLSFSPVSVGADHASGHIPKAPRPELGASAAFGPDGSLYAVTKRDGHVLLFRSRDEGVSWEAPAVVNPQPEAIAADGEDRPKLAFARDGGVLVAWTRPLSKQYTGEIRLARAADGQHFSAPLTVHRDRAEITHRFGSLVVAGDGRVLLAWIDKRDGEAAKGGKTPYAGAAIYAAVSTDGGKTFAPEYKVADHSCECCRIAATIDEDGAPLLMWRHVFAPNERDHALVRIKADGMPEAMVRATFDRWRIDGCPHHGPSLAVGNGGVRHAVWFNQKDGEGRVFYGRLAEGKESAIASQRALGGARAEHADLAAVGQRVAVAWKEFDGELARVFAMLSEDGGRTFRQTEIAGTAAASDQPRLLLRGEAFYVFWRTEREGMRVFKLN